MNFMKNMLYCIDMLNYIRSMLCFTIAVFLLLVSAVPGSCQGREHIRKLDTIRTSMTNMGSSLPEVIRKADAKDIRTVERVFEINNYALVTIESYLKMLKVAVASGASINQNVLDVLNGWLKFTARYCEYDIKYIDEALAQTKDAAIVDILKSEKNNITALREASHSGINENTALSNTL